jgi:protease-4
MERLVTERVGARGRAACRLAPGIGLGGALLAMGSGCVYVSGGINPFAQQRGALQETVVSGEGRDKILLLDVSDVITDVEREGSLGLSTEESTVARVEEALTAASDDHRVKAVVVRINSPGGGVTASDTVFHGIMQFKAETGVPVIASLQDLATSGAYYVALAADRIVATPTTVTGSVGVILVGLNVEGLMGKLGVADQTVKSGPHKDLLSPFRKPTPEERAIIQGVIDDLYHRFRRLVRKRRPQIAAGDLARVTDGRVFSAAQAHEIGLVDDIGYVEDAIRDARAAAGVERARVIMYHRPEEYRDNVYSGHGSGRGPSAGAAAAPATGGFELTVRLPPAAGPRFMYLWMPRFGGMP